MGTPTQTYPLIYDGMSSALLAPPDQGDEMGRHFCNGAAWDWHRTGFTGGTTIGCSTLNSADAYSSCTNHGGIDGKVGSSNYTYN